MNDQELFQKFRPHLSEITDVQTMEFYRQNGPILSVNGRRIPLDNFLLVLSTGPPTYGPYPLNATAARALCNLLIDHGFGPPELQPQ